MKIGSLFAGIGGLELGLERAGMEVIWQAETDPYASKVLAKHWPAVPNLGDITKVDWSRVERPDLVCGGFPCQPASAAGRRMGMDDARWLWPEFARCIRELGPKWVLAENVPGLLSVDAGGAFGSVLGDLAQLGFDVQWGRIPAAAVGAPHLRWRVFIVAYASRSGTGLEAHRSSGSEGESTESSSSAVLSQGNWSACPKGPDADCPDVADSPSQQSGRVLQRGIQPNLRAKGAARGLADPNSSGRPQRRGAESSETEHGAPECGGEMADPPSGGRERWRAGCCETASGGPFGVFAGSNEDGRGQWATEPDVGGTPDGFPAWLDGSERLNAWGPRWEDGIARVANGVPARVDRLKCLGNAVVPQVAEVVGRWIVTQDVQRCGGPPARHGSEDVRAAKVPPRAPTGTRAGVRGGRSSTCPGTELCREKGRGK